MSASVDAGASVELYRPYPNPFTGATAFAYKVDASDAAVDITVYDVAGRQIRKLVSGVQAAGQYTASWDGRNEVRREGHAWCLLCSHDHRGHAGPAPTA